MKLRLTPNSIRLRLNQIEVLKFTQEGILSERVDLPGPKPSALVYSLRFAGESVTGSAQFENGEFAVTVPQDQAKAWANSAKDVGLYYNHELASDQSLRIAIEKDYQCIDGPPEEHDPAGYPHPLVKAGCEAEKQ